MSLMSRIQRCQWDWINKMMMFNLVDMCNHREIRMIDMTMRFGYVHHPDEDEYSVSSSPCCVFMIINCVPLDVNMNIIPLISSGDISDDDMFIVIVTIHNIEYKTTQLQRSLHIMYYTCHTQIQTLHYLESIQYQWSPPNNSDCISLSFLLIIQTQP